MRKKVRTRIIRYSYTGVCFVNLNLTQSYPDQIIQHGLTYGEEKLKPLIERYAMLSNLRTELLANCSEVDEGAYFPSAYTKTIPDAEIE